MATKKQALKIFVLIELVLFGLGDSKAGGAIDLTATTSERVLEDIVFKQLVFHEDGRPVTYEPPRGWSYSGDANRIRFIPPGIAQAQAEIQQMSLPEPQSFDDARIKVLRAEVVASVPKGSQQVVVAGEEKNPVTINGRESYEITVTYNLFSQEYRLSALFMDLPRTQLQFRVIAKKDDFQKLNRLFRGSIFSLQWH